MSEDSPPPGSPRRKPWHLLGRAKLPITSTLLVAFGGLVAIAVTTVLMLSIRTARENTDQLQEETAQQRLQAAISRIERYLTLSAEGNLRVVYPTTAAQYFHVSESAINWMSTGYLFAFCVASP